MSPPLPSFHVAKNIGDLNHRPAYFPSGRFAEFIRQDSLDGLCPNNQSSIKLSAQIPNVKLAPFDADNRRRIEIVANRRH